MLGPRFLTPKLTGCLALTSERVQLPDAKSLRASASRSRSKARVRRTWILRTTLACKEAAKDVQPTPSGRDHPRGLFEALDLSVTAAAKWLGVSRVTLSELLNGHNGVTAEMAIRLEKAGWGAAESWLRNQVSYDLWQAKKRSGGIKVKVSDAGTRVNM
jgi:addiction module HigA family antidote